MRQDLAMSTKRIDILERMVDRLEDEAKKKQALLTAKKQALKNEKRKSDRRERNHRIYKLGGMVEKMGLDQLPEAQFLGLLAMMHGHVSRADFEQKSALAEKGQPFIEDGKKLEGVK